MFNPIILNKIYDGSNPLQNEFDKWENEKTRYKILKYGINDISIHEKEQHKTTLNKIYNSITDRFTLKDLSAFAMWLDIDDYKDYKWSKFIVDVFEHEIKRLDQTGENNGFVWKVISPEKNVTHYLIGTIHFTSKKIAQSPLYEEAIHNSQQLFTERGYCQEEQDVYEFKCKFFKNPIRFGIDAEIKKKAFEMLIPIQGLDLPDNFMQSSIKKTNDLFNNYQKLKKLPSFIEKPRYFKSIHGNILEISNALPYLLAWHQGILYTMPDYDTSDDLLGMRNAHWLNDSELEDVSGEKYKGLLNLLQNTLTSSCIAVGAGHCLNNDPRALLNAFQENGFIIERVSMPVKKE